MMIVDDEYKSKKEITKDYLMMIVDDDNKSKKEITKDSLLFFHISSLLRFPLVYERILMTSLNIDVDDLTYTHLLINGTADSPYPKRSFRDSGCLGY